MRFKDLFSKSIHAYLESQGTLPTFYNAIVNTSDDTLVAIGLYLPSVLLVSEGIMDTSVIQDISAASVQTLLRSDVRSYPEWSWNQGGQVFQRTNPAIVTESMRERSVLASKKIEAYNDALYLINMLRRKIYRGVGFQETIYAEKYRQARFLKEAGFDEKLVAAVPYVAHYSEDEHITLRQAAEEILFQSKLDHELLLKTERTRLRLFKKIRRAKTTQEVADVLDTYRRTRVV